MKCVQECKEKFSEEIRYIIAAGFYQEGKLKFKKVSSKTKGHIQSIISKII